MYKLPDHYMRDYSNRRRTQRRIFAKKHLGGCCKSCGTIDHLHFDHIIRETKRMEISSMLMAKKSVFMEELNKCQLLCRPCHVAKCRIDGSFQVRGETKHGTGHAYMNHKCRCEKCRNWKSAYCKHRRIREMATHFPAKKV